MSRAPDQDRPDGAAQVLVPAIGDVVLLPVRVVARYSTVMLVKPKGPGPEGFQSISFWANLTDVAGPG